MTATFPFKHGDTPTADEWNAAINGAGQIGIDAAIAEATRALAAEINIARSVGSSRADVTKRAPGISDDAAHGYAVGDMWLFGNDVYSAIKVTTNAAVWQPILSASALPIDAIGGVAPIFAYGTMKLTSAYAGHAVNVVRTSDSAALDIDFMAGGALNSAALDAFSPGVAVRVATFYDQSGAANNATAIAANRPAMAQSNTIGAARSVVFDTTHASSLGPVFTSMAIPSAGAATAGAISFLTLMRSVDSAGINLFPVELTGTNAIYAGYSATGTKWVLNRTGTQIAQMLTKPTVSPEFFGFSLGFGANTFISGNTLVSGNGSGLSTALTGGTLGSSATGATSGGLEVVAALGYARALSAAELLNARAAFYRVFQVYPQVRDTLLIVGDSITAGTDQSLNINYARRILPLLTLPMTTIVDGRFGDTIADMDANFAFYYSVIVNPLATNNVITVFAGTNDIGGSATGAATWAHMASFCGKARAVGFKVAIATMLPRASLTGPQQTEWTAYNTLIRANWNTVADALIDVQADDVIGPFAAAANTALYVDGIHPADGMPMYFASLFASAINGLLR